MLSAASSLLIASGGGVATIIEDFESWDTSPVKPTGWTETGTSNSFFVKSTTHPFSGTTCGSVYGDSKSGTFTEFSKSFDFTGRSHLKIRWSFTSTYPNSHVTLFKIGGATLSSPTSNTDTGVLSPNGGAVTWRELIFDVSAYTGMNTFRISGGDQGNFAFFDKLEIYV